MNTKNRSACHMTEHLQIFAHVLGLTATEVLASTDGGEGSCGTTTTCIVARSGSSGFCEHTFCLRCSDVSIRVLYNKTTIE